MKCNLSPDLQKDWPKKYILRGVAGTLMGNTENRCKSTIPGAGSRYFEKKVQLSPQAEIEARG